MTMTLIEVCVEDRAGVEAARNAGAERVELCVDVNCGGLTPSLELVRECWPVAPSGGLRILVRPRPGDFVHDEAEIEEIISSITAIRQLEDTWEGEKPAAPIGFVVGVTTPTGELNASAMEKIALACGDAPHVCHRAFDVSDDQDRAMDLLMSLGYCAALTTGGHPSVAQVEELRRLQERGGEKFTIIASGGLRPHNVAEITRECGAREIHMRAPWADGGEHEGTTTDPECVSTIVRSVRQLSENG